MDTPKLSSQSSSVFNLINETNKNKITLSLENKKNYLEILAKDESLSNENEFIVAYTHYSLNKLHKFFKIFESLNEAMECLTQIIQNKEAKIYSSEKEGIILELNVIIGIKKEIIKMNLHKRNINLEETVFQLNKKIEEMQEDIKKLKLAVFGEEKKEKDNIDFGQIVKNKNEKIFLIKEIEKKLNTKIKSAKVIFSTKTDGDDPSTFHKKCDHKYNTLTLIEAVNNRRFGGFANLPWCSADVYKDDKNCFLFSLDFMEAYYYKNDGKGVHSHPNYGPSFGSRHDINIQENCLSDKKCYTDEGSFDYKSRSAALSGIKDYVQLNAYEVIEIIV